MQRITKTFLGLICAGLAAIFSYLTVFSLLYTCIVEPHANEFVFRVQDNLVLGLLLLILGFFALRYLTKLGMGLPLALVTGTALALTLLGGILIALLTQLHPRADQANVYNAATELVLGNWQSITADYSYFHRLSYQLGLLQYMEIMQRLFGTECYLEIRLVNAAALTAVNAALLSILWQSFHRRDVQVCASILLTLFMPSILYVTFIYGNLPGQALALWGAEQGLRWMRQGKGRHAALGLLFLCLSVVFKLNYIILAIAAGFALLVFALHSRKALAGALAVCFAVCPYLFSKVPIKVMEARTGVAFDQGTPMTAWLVMGLQEGSRAPGWYNSYVWNMPSSVGFDSELTRQRIAGDLAERLKVFWEDPAYGISFFHSKLTSQWAETTYESIWVNLNLKRQGAGAAQGEGLLGNSLLPQYMEAYAILLYGAFALAMLIFARNMLSPKRSRPMLPYGMLMLAVAVLGGMTYHMLFEAKSQYLCTYVPMMIPLAAYGVMQVPVPRRLGIASADAAQESTSV